jgi:hypothetical protein
MNQAGTRGRTPVSKKEAKSVERRSSDWLPFSAVAELVEPLSRTRMAVRIADMSNRGCYADALNAMPVGTKVSISITHANAQFQTCATVTYSLPGMGMGLSFDELSPKMEFILNRWIAEVRGEASPPPGATEVNAAIQKYEQIEQRVLSRLINLMIRKTLLTPSEGTHLLDELLHED